MECSEKYVADESYVEDNLPFGKEFQRSQAKQRECLNRPSVIDWDLMEPSLYRAELSIGLVLNRPPVSTLAHTVETVSARFVSNTCWSLPADKVIETCTIELINDQPYSLLPALREIDYSAIGKAYQDIPVIEDSVPKKRPLCRRHPHYNAIYAPRAECSICWDAWDAKHGREGLNHG